jgi:hypothetical protein
MEFLCASELLLSAVGMAGSRVMNNGYRLAVIAGGRSAASKGKNAPPSSFWPEVNRAGSWESLGQMKPENSPSRVFLEVFLILGVAGLVAVAAAIWIPIMS